MANLKDCLNISACIAAAYAADEAYEFEVQTAGYASRWDVPSILKQESPLREAYLAKVKADKELHAAFVAARNS